MHAYFKFGIYEEYLTFWYASFWCLAILNAVCMYVCLAVHFIIYMYFPSYNIIYLWIARLTTGPLCKDGQSSTCLRKSSSARTSEGIFVPSSTCRLLALSAWSVCSFVESIGAVKRKTLFMNTTVCLPVCVFDNCKRVHTYVYVIYVLN